MTLPLKALQPLPEISSRGPAGLKEWPAAEESGLITAIPSGQRKTGSHWKRSYLLG